jgi:ABC-type uncharacterized transport system involved in gliding motility auxiliary subunit
MELRMNLQKKQYTVLALGVVIIALLLANSFIYFFRLDLSSARSYSVSQVSRKLIAALPASVEIRYYLSPALKNRDPGFQQIEDVLYEYSLASKGKITLEVIDPKGSKENDAAGYGIQPRNLNVVDQAQVSQTRVYSGIVIRYLDSYKTIPFVSSSEVLEYELGVQLLQLSREKNLVLALLNGGAGQDILGSYSLLLRELGKLYDVREIKPGEDIPLDADVLFVFKAEELEQEALLGVERFILSGKGVMIGAEPYGIDLQYGLMLKGPRNESSLLAMLEHYGVSVGHSMVIDEYNKFFPVTRQQGRVQYQEMVPYPFWINLAREDANRSHPLAAGVESLDLLWTSPVVLKEGVEGETVFSSTPASKLVKDSINLNPEQGHFLMAMTQGEASTNSVAVTRTGAITSYFKTKDQSLDLPDSSAGARLLVIGDSDFASDLIQYSDSGANIQFILNSLVWLGNDAELSALRARKPASPTLSKQKDPKVKVASETVSLALNAVLIPLGVGLYGAIRLIRRRKNRNA